MTRHKVFISYHRDDLPLVLSFIQRFDHVNDIFIHRSITMPEDVINSENPEYIMSQIRTRFLQDSSVTMLLVGKCTWSRRFVDWELQSSLRQPADGKPNGLLAVLLDPTATSEKLPERASINVLSGYAKFYKHPRSADSLEQWIEDAYQARASRANMIKNPRERMRYNKSCS